MIFYIQEDRSNITKNIGFNHRLPLAGLRPFDFIDTLEWGGRPPWSVGLMKSIYV